MSVASVCIRSACASSFCTLTLAHLSVLASADKTMAFALACSLLADSNALLRAVTPTNVSGCTLAPVKRVN